MIVLKRLYISALRWVVVVSIIGMLAMVFANVVLRYAFNSGIFLSEGLSGLLFVWMTFVGSLLLLYERGHIGVDTLVRKFPVSMRRAAFVLVHAVMLYVTWLLLQGAWQQFLINLEVMSPATRLPIGLVYAAGVFFAFASGLFLLGQLVLMLTGRLNDAHLTVSAAEDEAEAERLLADMQIEAGRTK